MIFLQVVAGNDVFWGGLGNDSLTGGDGNDQFYYTDLLEGADTITDFGQNADQDKIFICTFSNHLNTHVHLTVLVVITLFQWWKPSY